MNEWMFNDTPEEKSAMFTCTIPQDRIAHTTAFVKPVVEHWLEWELSPLYPNLVLLMSKLELE